MANQIPEGYVAITFILPQKDVSQLDYYLAEEYLKAVTENPGYSIRPSRARWVRSVVEKQIEKLRSK